MLATSKLSSIEVLICKALIDLKISHDEFVLINKYVLKEYVENEEEIKNVRIQIVHWILYFIYKIILSYCLKCRKNTEGTNPKVARSKNERAMLLSICAVCDTLIPLISTQHEFAPFLWCAKINGARVPQI